MELINQLTTDKLTLALLFLWTVSEFLALNPKTKSNSVVQLVHNVLKAAIRFTPFGRFMAPEPETEKALLDKVETPLKDPNELGKKTEKSE